jgi:hypothetical protein
MAEVLQVGLARNLGKGRSVREHTHHAGSFYEAIPDETLKAHQTLSSFDRGDLEEFEPLLFVAKPALEFTQLLALLRILRICESHVTPQRVRQNSEHQLLFSAQNTATADPIVILHG